MNNDVILRVGDFFLYNPPIGTLLHYIPDIPKPYYVVITNVSKLMVSFVADIVLVTNDDLECECEDTLAIETFITLATRVVKDEV